MVLQSNLIDIYNMKNKNKYWKNKKMSNLISIVLPVHNELLNLRFLIESWNSELKKISSIEYEFVIVEDGSTDGAKELIEELEKNFPIINLSSEKKRGYSQAVLDGIKASNEDYILCTDSDNQIKLNSLFDLLNFCFMRIKIFTKINVE